MSSVERHSKRTLHHRRNIDVQGYLREDGLWEVEGVLKDTKGHDITLPDRGIVEQGGFLHHMRLTITFDNTFTIVDAYASMYDTPYQDCPGAARQYEALIGLQIKKGWINGARKALGRVTSCTHVTEMLPAMATAAIQTIRGYRINNEGGFESSDNERKNLLNSCFGFRPGGRAQHLLWPDEIE